MPSFFFKIGSTDLTPKADIQEYSVNRVDVYDTWTDGNRIEHREVTRTRIEGSIKLGFKSEADLSSFLSLLSGAKTADGYWSCGLYLQNAGTTATANVFLDPVGEAKWDTKNGRAWIVQTLAVRER